MCPFTLGSGYGWTNGMWIFGIKVFLLAWTIFVPIVITARLEKIIKLLEQKK